MYAFVVLAQTLLLPVGCTAIEWLGGNGDLLPIFGKWLLFWGIGTRLLLAGFTQVLDPARTLQLLRVHESTADVLVRELGFANLGIGLVAAVSAFVPGWIVPGAGAGVVFLAAAGIGHLGRAERSGRETLAMWTDLWVAAAMLVVIVAELFAR
ncbi:hypothetical protein [Agromyces seonyuensis]|uniref:DoxX family protein n=1 Tax=Agromyces seonyuensis TaxID=2662446 RepID=A0A6I4NTE2_9MICO|nr:hypothetical protein [Agromyces seonyuensis]MWB97493.1 hypothetical protein [Agromyces seonyuensis]